MNIDKLLELMMYAVPSLIVGAVAFYMFQSHFKDQQNTRKWLLLREKQKHSMPLKLQAYERLALFLERINPSKLLIRVAPLSDNKEEYQNLLIRHIEQEYEHNLTQQIYITDDAWVMILNAKNAIIQNIRKTTLDSSIENADKLREKILSNLLEGESASTVALAYLKTEVAQVLG
ncbi:DUF7935 family protein [Flavobacterium capsici]|uniref:Uncharacterized protein n=1 Tax=Flavobacterium capsici TaxID=3075618 RepID=A0AA96J4V6_9FLAO|nr:MULTISPECIES: hypothetical protein [unclassified Flavobacterium]WNM18436.1 hypothetical protein RN608_10480 [Flavobacterium sp. PMR2A8]WNM22487.1 hypothetical protein RN605_03780 [Flavobacterium sp. PMTSA4]